MRQAQVYYNNELAGVLTEAAPDSYIFEYASGYFMSPAKPAISMGLPKTTQQHRSAALFPFFYNMLSEGDNRQAQCRLLKLDAADDFGLLLLTAGTETIGAVTVKALYE
jgi:HipA-like protein